MRTSPVTVTAHMNNEVTTYPTQVVDFHLDSNPQDPNPNGILIGTSTTKDGNNNFSIIWDASSTAPGLHTLTCWAYYYGCCSSYVRSESISINLVDSIQPPPEIPRGNSPSEALLFGEDKVNINWQAESPANGYGLYRGTLSDLPFLQDNNIDSCTRYDGSSISVDLSSDDPSAVSGKLYFYLVTGYNNGGE